MRYKSKHEKLKPHYPFLVFRVAALLVCLVLMTTYLLSGAYSKFYTSVSGGDRARVARFSPEFTSTVIQIPVEDQLPGFPDILNNAYEIPFEVKNASDDKVSEVAMKYKIVLKTTGNMPLTFTLLDGETELIKWNCDGRSGEQKYDFTKDSFVFGVGTKETQNYTLRIEWSSEKKDAQFSGMTDAVYLAAEFEQID